MSAGRALRIIRSATAEGATLHLAPRPGEDPTLLAGMVRVRDRD